MPDTFSFAPAPTSCRLDLRGSGAIVGLFGPRSPSSTLAVPIAERVRAALMRASDFDVPWQISGKDARDHPCRGHEHLYILPFASSTVAGRSPGLNRVLLWASAGFEASTLAVIERLASRSGRVQLRGHPSLRLELLALGSRSQLCQAGAARFLGPARQWRSTTAFVAPRFPKPRRGLDLNPPREQLERLIADVHGLAVERVVALKDPGEHWQAFEQRRAKPVSQPRRPASGWLVEFTDAVAGPIVVGHGAHFGLGVFEIEKISAREDRSDGAADEWEGRS